MKDFKCRIYEHKTGKMQYSSESLALTLDGKLMQCEINDQEGMFIKKESYEMLLFTGLKDKNEKEIYEGDVVLTHRHTYDDPPYQVTIKDIRHLPEELFGSAVLSREVVGNIYQNPEMI